MRQPSHARRAPHGQAMVEMALGSLVFVTVIAFGIYFSEVSFLSLKVQESAISALWDGTNGKMHTIPLSFDAGGAMNRAAANASQRYADFNGLSSENRPSAQLVYTRSSDLSVNCRTGGAPDFEGAFLTRAAYRGNGGAQCGAQATLSAVNFPRSFLDDNTSGAFFKGKHMKNANTRLKVCSTGRPVSNECRGTYSMMVDDWGLTSAAETAPCLLVGGGLTTCTNVPMAAAVFSVYLPLSFLVIPHSAASAMALGMVGASTLPVGMAGLDGVPDEHLFFMSAANEETNFMQLPLLGRDLMDTNVLPWGTTPGAVVNITTAPYALSYIQRRAKGNCFLGKDCVPY